MRGGGDGWWRGGGGCLGLVGEWVRGLDTTGETNDVVYIRIVSLSCEHVFSN